jgi:two-component system, LytTR family, response regulator
VTLRTLVVDDERLARERVTTLVRDRPELTLIGEAQDGRTALDLIVEHRPDLVFLDVQMPELDGFQIIGALDGAGESLPAVVFVTAYDAYALRAFEVAAMDYLLKPVTVERFAAAVSRVLARTAQQPSGISLHAFAEQAVAARAERPTRFVARRGAKHYFVRVVDVDWIEADGNYVRVQTGDSVHLIRDTMHSVEAKLDPEEFVRIHRSAIVAIDRIRSIEARESGEYLVTLRGGATLVSSRGYSDRVRALLR